jgi:hypothetical protein
MLVKTRDLASKTRGTAKIQTRLFALLFVLIAVFSSGISACNRPSTPVGPAGPITKMPEEMVLKITDLEGDGWTLTESVPVSEHGAEYAYQVAFCRETSAGLPSKKMVTCKAALYYKEAEAHSAFLTTTKNEVPTLGLNIGDEAFLEIGPSVNGKAIAFRKANIVVWIWMNHDGDIESLAEVLKERVSEIDSNIPSEVREAVESRAAVLKYLQSKAGNNAPSPDAHWQHKAFVPPAMIGAHILVEFQAGDWFVRVSWVSPSKENPHRVVVLNTQWGWRWEGVVELNGNITELSPFHRVSQEESLKIAEDFVRRSSTFVFDGIEDSLQFVKRLDSDLKYTWTFVFKFESRQAGYGDRTGQLLAEVITPHEAEVTVECGEVKTAVVDGRWDMLSEKFLPGREHQ